MFHYKPVPLKLAGWVWSLALTSPLKLFMRPVMILNRCRKLRWRIWGKVSGAMTSRIKKVVLLIVWLFAPSSNVLLKVKG